jgi:hypothetical protein
MKLEHSVQLLLGVVILGTLGWLSTNLFEMKGVMSSVDTKVTMNEERLSRISSVLPEVQAKVAWEEVNYSIKGFIASTEPKLEGNNQWKSYINLYSADDQILKTYTLNFDESQKALYKHVVAGKLVSDGGYNPSFQTLSAHSSEMRNAVLFPASIDPKTSFVLRESKTSDIESFLNDVAGEPEKTKIVKVRNWNEITEKLGEIERAITKIEMQQSESNK